MSTRKQPSTADLIPAAVLRNVRPIDAAIAGDFRPGDPVVVKPFLWGHASYKDLPTDVRRRIGPMINETGIVASVDPAGIVFVQDKHDMTYGGPGLPILAGFVRHASGPELGFKAKDPRSQKQIRAGLVGKYAYVAVVNPAGKGYVLARAHYGIPGLETVMLKAFPTHEEASSTAERLNAKLGLTDEEAFMIITSSMPKEKP